MYLDNLPNDDTLFSDFGKTKYSKEFWDKINEQNRISNERYNREEQILTPTNEQLKKVFFIRK